MSSRASLRCDLNVKCSLAVVCAVPSCVLLLADGGGWWLCLTTIAVARSWRRPEKSGRRRVREAAWLGRATAALRRTTAFGSASVRAPGGRPASQPGQSGSEQHRHDALAGWSVQSRSLRACLALARQCRRQAESAMVAIFRRTRNDSRTQQPAIVCVPSLRPALAGSVLPAKHLAVLLQQERARWLPPPPCGVWPCRLLLLLRMVQVCARRTLTVSNHRHRHRHHRHHHCGPQEPSRRRKVSNEELARVARGSTREGVASWTPSPAALGRVRSSPMRRRKCSPGGAGHLQGARPSGRGLWPRRRRVMTRRGRNTLTQTTTRQEKENYSCSTHLHKTDGQIRSPSLELVAGRRWGELARLAESIRPSGVK